jgi:hypothetical protein
MLASGNSVKNLREQTLCPIKIFVGYGGQSLIQFFSPFTQEQSPFMAMFFIKFCYRNHQLGKLIHVRFGKKVNGF